MYSPDFVVAVAAYLETESARLDEILPAIKYSHRAHSAFKLVFFEWFHCILHQISSARIGFENISSTHLRFYDAWMGGVDQNFRILAVQMLREIPRVEDVCQL